MKNSFNIEPRKTMNDNLISVVIVTKNRQKQLKKCLESLSKSNFLRFEVIVVDQSKKYNTDFKQLKLPLNLKYYHTPTISGKSKGLNYGIKQSSASLIAFTDDDCLMSSDWLSTIFYTFKENKQISGVYGRVLPYQEFKNKDKICACTFEEKKSYFITIPDYHWGYIGLGNNMAYKKSDLIQAKGFREWLGPGSIGSNAEDAEMSIRMLVNKKILYYNSKIIIRHNRWLTDVAYQKQMLSYICGEVSCYGYYALKGHSFAKRVIKKNVFDSIYEFRMFLIARINSDFQSTLSFYTITNRLLVKLKGITIALFFYLYER